MKNTSRILLAILGGVAVGAAIGILFAPDKGSETRRKITDSAKDLGNKAKSKFRSGVKTVEDIKASINEEIDELV